MTISIKPTASGSTIEQDGSTILTVDGSGNISAENNFTATGHVLQVVSTTKTDTQSFTSTSTNTYADLTGLSVSITPSSTSSKILVMYTVNISVSVGTGNVIVVRNSTPIGVGDASSNRLQANVAYRNQTTPYTFGIETLSYNFLDTPSSTSALTYKLQGTLGANYNGTFYVNRTPTDTDASYGVRTASTITVMEIAG